jgi:hypothetical protein
VTTRRDRARWVVTAGGGYLSGHRWRWAAELACPLRLRATVVPVAMFDAMHAREQAELHR